MNFTAGEVMAIASMAASLVGAYYMLRAHINTKFNLAFEKMDKIKFGPEQKKQLTDLHEWHNVSDDDNVKVWYVRKSLEKAMLEMSESINNMTASNDRLYTILDALNRTNEDIKATLYQQKNK